MSLKVIKSSLENYLGNNITDVAIKWSNASVYTLNDVVLTQDQINVLDIYIEPVVVSSTNRKEILGGSNCYKQKNFFMIHTYISLNSGMGDAMDMADRLIALFKEQTISGVVCENYEYMPYFQEGENIVLPVRITTYKYTI